MLLSTYDISSWHDLVAAAFEDWGETTPVFEDELRDSLLLLAFRDVEHWLRKTYFWRPRRCGGFW